MGYFIAITAIGILAWLFSADRPALSLLILIGGLSSIGVVALNEIERKRRREERERERIRLVKENFQKLQLQIVTNEGGQPYAFRSLFDATRSFPRKPYSYPEIRNLYFVVNGVVTTERERDIIESFLGEFYNINGSSASARKTIYVVDESQDAKNEKERIATEREAQRLRILEIALADIDGRTKEDVGQGGSALYVMSSKLGVKIGISDEPQKRLGQVQTGHPTKVSLFKVVWFFSRKDAELVEKTIHGLLKLQKAHASGEWFNLKVGEAADAVSRVVRDLIQKGKVDSHRREIHTDRVANDPDLALAKLISLRWKISHKGNEWLKLGDKNITIFPRRSRWGYVCDGEFSNGTFETKKEAKVAALQMFLERFGNITAA